MKIQALLETAARDLPPGWTIQICVERGAAWVRLEAPGEVPVEIDSADLSIEEQVALAIEKALGVKP